MRLLGCALMAGLPRLAKPGGPGWARGPHADGTSWRVNLNLRRREIAFDGRSSPEMCG